MNGVAVGLVAQLLLAAGAVAAVLLAPDRRRHLVGGVTTAAVAAAGLATGLAATTGSTGSVRLPTALVGQAVELAPDRLGGLFLAVVSGVGLLVAVYAVGYAHGPSNSRTSWVALPLFLLGMQLVPVAADVVSFLLAWEVMAAASTVLLLADHRRRPEVGSAALWYAAMTQLSFLLLLAGFAVLAATTGSTSFAAMAGSDPTTFGAGVAFVLLLVGFAAKAGVVPLHVWLPRAHPEAPSHVSAAMSAAMVKLGVYGALLVTVRLLPGGPSWWAVLLLVLGGVSAVFGILQASVTSDVKKLLGYSTTENVGLMFLALGAALLLRSYGVAGAGDVALLAVLLLAVSHAAFKVTLFLGAGAALHATGVRDLDQLGGLGARMPWTAAAFGVAALGAAALPVTSGFVAEWTLLQALVHGVQPGDRLVAVATPAAVSVIALTAGLALLTFAKAYGIAFLARPRSDAAGSAREVPWPMRATMLVGAGAVLVVGLFPGPLAESLAATVGVSGIGTVGLAGLDLPQVDALLDPWALVLLAAAVAAPVGVAVAVVAARRPRRRTALVWGCGGARVSPRMQYTATSYAEPLLRVFDDAIRPDRDVEVTHVAESRYLVSRVQFRQRVCDVVEGRVYRPVLRAADRVGDAARGLQNGSIHRYLAYSFAALVVVLLSVTL